jgi:hypothetical protein
MWLFRFVCNEHRQPKNPRKCQTRPGSLTLVPPTTPRTLSIGGVLGVGSKKKL